mmetsp:Transcript_4873/g.12067  ORF Transcript_4873/g.12067 Transcript_4873/m.12067 type:complete len:1375 (-) Transcript_4873:463-4587(-)|eukprot:CAMPEP_0178988304 /NCGR_PEP_ID=MMETSP0795-20121207/3740_1 /TAXON_ID=88552 /ORGANISM="Amoebophrya sp., Strain Ameob2" /LENGTH=1374 /DNA_ID=CAMNT_0020679571 /DNA_START=412 /DNA_END=4536 /DNA_ORIENTATION=-
MDSFRELFESLRDDVVAKRSSLECRRAYTHNGVSYTYGFLVEAVSGFLSLFEVALNSTSSAPQDEALVNEQTRWSSWEHELSVMRSSFKQPVVLLYMKEDLRMLPALVIATLCHQAVLVVLNPDDAEERKKIVLRESAPSLVMVASEEQKGEVAKMLREVFGSKTGCTPIFASSASTAGDEQTGNGRRVEQQGQDITTSDEKMNSSSKANKPKASAHFYSSDPKSTLSHIFFTSGSSGSPKGCICTAHNLSAYCAAKNTKHGISETSVVLLASPPSFDPCLGDIVATLLFARGELVLFSDFVGLVGAAATPLAPNERPSETFCEAFAPVLTRVTHILTTPTLFGELIRAVEEKGPLLLEKMQTQTPPTTSDTYGRRGGGTPVQRGEDVFCTLAWQQVALGGETMRTEHIKWVEEMNAARLKRPAAQQEFSSTRSYFSHSFCQLANTYGVTECCIYQAFHQVVAFNKAEGDTDTDTGAKCVTSSEIKNCDLLGEPLSPSTGTTGTEAVGREKTLLASQDVVAESSGGSATTEKELVIFGPLVGLGYLNMPELTKERFAFRCAGGRSSAGGGKAAKQWSFRTGDLVELVPPEPERRTVRQEDEQQEDQDVDVLNALVADEVGSLGTSSCIMGGMFVHEPNALPLRDEPLTSEETRRGPPQPAREPPQQLRLLGRLDDQVKLRGQRVELGEIESVLLQEGRLLVDDVAAVVVEDADKEEFGGAVAKKLVVFCVPRQNVSARKVGQGKIKAKRELEQRLLTACFRTYVCEQSLSRNMHPAAFILVDEIPKTATGKVARRVLADRFSNLRSGNDADENGPEDDEQIHDDDSDFAAEATLVISAANDAEGEKKRSPEEVEKLNHANFVLTAANRILEVWEKHIGVTVERRIWSGADIDKDKKATSSAKNDIDVPNLVPAADFLALGGDSISAVRVCTTLQQLAASFGFREQASGGDVVSDEVVEVDEQQGGKITGTAPTALKALEAAQLKSPFLPKELLTRPNLKEYVLFLCQHCEESFPRAHINYSGSKNAGDVKSSTSNSRSLLEKAVRGGCMYIAEFVAGREPEAFFDCLKDLVTLAIVDLGDFCLVEAVLRTAVALEHSSQASADGLMGPPMASFPFGRGGSSTSKSKNAKKSSATVSPGQLQHGGCFINAAASLHRRLKGLDETALLVRCLQQAPASVERAAYVVEGFRMAVSGLQSELTGVGATIAPSRRTPEGTLARERASSWRNAEGQTILHVAARAGCATRVLKFLCDDVLVVPSKSTTTSRKKKPLVPWSRGTNCVSCPIDPVDCFKRTPLHWAVVNGHRSAAEFFLSRGADKGLRDVDGENAVQMAERRALCANAGARDGPASLWGGIAKVLGGSGTTKILHVGNYGGK